jgi:hypothetical protein
VPVVLILCLIFLGFSGVLDKLHSPRRREPGQISGTAYFKVPTPSGVHPWPLVTMTSAPWYVILIPIMQPPPDEPTEQENKARRAREKALGLYPLESWREIGERIFIAEGREPKSKNQRQILDKELVQARILAAQGSTVYLLPEVLDPENIGVKYPDAVVDGFVMEFKTITGNIRQIEERFKESMKKAESVFLKIDSGLSRHEVSRKLAGIIAQKGYRGGLVIVYFTRTAELFRWNIDDLK